VVPEDYAHPVGRTIALPVVVLPATSDRAEPDPILYPNGGPGASAMGWLSVTAGIGPARQTPDHAVLKQRGNGTAEPALLCADGEEVRACYDRMAAEGTELAHYTNSNSARDVEILRRALGAERVNLYGISYGTSLALHVVRMCPDGIRSLVLGSASALDADIAWADATSQLDGLTRLYDACAENAARARCFPDWRASFLAHVKHLNIQPRPVRTEALQSLIGPELDGRALVVLTVNMMQNSILLPRVPALVDALARGKEEQALALAGDSAPEIPTGFDPERSTALGLALSI
jgi:pimeloyl-ACP methyl ester carboxylesterase